MEVRFHAEESLKGSLLLVGFPSRGLVGGVAVNYVIDELRMWHVASLYDPCLPPTVSIRDGVAHSPIQFFASAERCGPDGACDKLVACRSEVLLEPKLLNEVAWEVIRWAKAQSMKHIVVLEGMEAPDEKSVQGNGPGRSDGMRLRGIRSLASNYVFDPDRVHVQRDGTVTGYSASFLLAANAQDADLVAFFGEARPDIADAGVAARLLHQVDPMLPHLEFDTERLTRRAVKLQDKVSANAKQLAALKKANEMMYV